jgi:hypothetical protein
VVKRASATVDDYHMRDQIDTRPQWKNEESDDGKQKIDMNLYNPRKVTALPPIKK